MSWGKSEGLQSLHATAVNAREMIASSFARWRPACFSAASGRSLLVYAGIFVLVVSTTLNLVLLYAVDPAEVYAHVQSYGPKGAPANRARVSPAERLAVVVPVHQGDLHKALLSLEKWPVALSDETQNNVDLILYKAEHEDSTGQAMLPYLEQTVGKKFARVKVVFAGLTEEENVYPQGPSVQFYKMFLDEKVKEHFKEYQVFAIIEWDVLVAHETSFSQLYNLAFGGVEPFWVKGSVLEGTNFHQTATKRDLWHVLGHINGNALYNNTDPRFGEFVDYTRTRWAYNYPYDVALWATIADFPYSWPLWQRYSIKFATTNLIANVGFHDVDKDSVLKAVAHDTLFIHGSTTGGGGHSFHADEKKHLALHAAGLAAVKYDTSDRGCKEACGKAAVGFNRGVSSVCDPSCIPGDTSAARFDGFMCGAGDVSKYGRSCRTCYADPDKGLEAEKHLAKAALEEGTEYAKGKHVIMCDTLRPPSHTQCQDKCSKKDDTVCDHRCGTGFYGDYNCNWRDHGSACRYCFVDLKEALQADKIAIARGGRVIMCDTYEPPVLPMEEGGDPLAAAVEDVRGMVREAMANRKPSSEEEESDVGEHLLGSADSSSGTERSQEQPNDMMGTDEVVYDHPSMIPYHGDVTRGNICAFIAGYLYFLAETEVTIKSISYFMPGVRIAIAVHPAHFEAYNRTLGDYPGVTISQVKHSAISGLIADKLCGNGTELIHYVKTGELYARSITYKDTHSPQGDLLVLHTSTERLGGLNVATAKATTAVLAFNAPSFTFSADLVLPVNMNSKLRKVLLEGDEGGEGVANRQDAAVGRWEDAAGGEGDHDEDDMRAMELLQRYRGVDVPQMLAALAYAHNEPGLWFVDPPQWVTHHMFQDVSIWEIPLVKPRFGCSLDMSLGKKGYDLTATLGIVFERLKGGHACETGYIEPLPSDLIITPGLEFGAAIGIPMPDIASRKVSVVYSLGLSTNDDLFFRDSLASVVKHFPRALEVVVLANSRRNESAYIQDVLTAQRETSPFPIRVVTDEEVNEAGLVRGMMATARVHTWRRMHSELACKGDFIMHLDTTAVLYADVVYDRVFRMSKPVLPILRPSLREPKHLASCRKDQTEVIFGEAVRYKFAGFRSNTYPRAAFTGLRAFVEKMHGKPLQDVMRAASAKSGSWAVPADAVKQGCSVANREILLPDFEFLGAYLWNEQHDEMHWVGVNPADLDRDDWKVDAYRYSWICQAELYNAAHVDKEVFDGYLADLNMVSSPTECIALQSRWAGYV